MPWLEGKLTLTQVEWLAGEFGCSTESVQNVLAYGISDYGSSCAAIAQEETHYEKTGDTRFNTARRAMARMILEAYGHTEKSWHNKYEDREEAIL